MSRDAQKMPSPPQLSDLNNIVTELLSQFKVTDSSYFNETDQESSQKGPEPQMMKIDTAAKKSETMYALDEERASAHL